MVLNFVISGCGFSMGVPTSNGNWGECSPNNAKNYRTRCGAIIFHNSSCILIDTPPDLRTQLLQANVSNIDAVLFTHPHADQMHGIDDVRVFRKTRGTHVPAYMDSSMYNAIHTSFQYCLSKEHFGIYEARLITPYEHFEVCGLRVLSILQEHGSIHSLGFIFPDYKLAYCNDVSTFSQASFDYLRGINTLIIDCMSRTPSFSHAHLDLVLEWVNELQPARTVLTNLGYTMDYDTLKAALPQSIEPAYDGMVITLPGMLQ